jgi:hypothetical protein
LVVVVVDREHLRVAVEVAAAQCVLYGAVFQELLDLFLAQM